MRDLWIHKDDLLVGTHGRSMWALDDITPLRQMAAAVNSAVFLFKPAPAYRVRRDINSDTPLPPDEPAGQNPPDGAIIDYVLGDAVIGPVTLEIRDAAGKAVRRFSSDDKAPFTLETLRQTLGIPTYWVRMPRSLSNAPGMHRFVWDLRETPPQSSEYGYPISAIPHDTPREPSGPLVLPGRYTVRLTAQDKILTVPLNVIMDPRVLTPPSGLRQQYEVESGLLAMINESFEARGELSSLDHQLDALSKQAQGSVAEAVSGLRAKVSALLGSRRGRFAPGPSAATLSSVAGEVGGLYGQAGGADVAPTATLMAALAVVQKDYGEVMGRWKAIKSTDLPALNRQLSAGGLTVIKLQADPEPASETENEE
jgi:hypothetical protein